MLKVIIQSSNGDIFEVDNEILKCSKTIQTMLEVLNIKEDDNEVVPLANVNTSTLRKVIQWATYHKNDPPIVEDQERKKSKSTDISRWDADFMNVDEETILAIIRAADYLEIVPLLNLGCKVIANIISSKSVEELQEMWKLSEHIKPAKKIKISKD